MLAACWRVDVMNGALGLALTGFFTISLIVNSELLIKFQELYENLKNNSFQNIKKSVHVSQYYKNKDI